MIKLKNIYIIPIIIFILLIGILFINNEKKQNADSLENLNLAYNLSQGNGFSVIYEGENSVKSNFREPLYPFLLSFINSSLFSESKSYEGFLKKKINNLKYFNFFILILFILTTYAIVRKFRFNILLELFTISLLSFGHYLAYLNVFLTELIAADFLLLHSFL